jgi:hypothetical protein
MIMPGIIELPELVQDALALGLEFCKQCFGFVKIGKILTVTDFGGVDIGIHPGTRRSTGFGANTRGNGAG